MNNFSKRLIFGILYVLLIVLATITNIYIFYSLFFIFMIFTIYEFQKMIILHSNIPYIFSVTLFISSLLIHTNNTAFGKLFLLLGMLTIFSSFLISLFNGKIKAVDFLGKIALTTIYTITPFFLLIELPFIGDTFNPKIILGIFILIWTSDTFAYLVGRKFGKTKLFERISPKKTIEGFIGGVMFTAIAAYILSLYFINTTLLEWFIIAILISIFGVAGDLIESMFKRQAKVKDSSNLIPGHGGFLDRLDSIIFAIPFIFTFIYLTKNLF